MVFTVFRRDRTGRRGGGVALYEQSTIQSSTTAHSSCYGCASSPVFSWPRSTTCLVRCTLQPTCSATSRAASPKSITTIRLRTSFSQATSTSDDDIIERTGLTQLVHQPTRGANLLDRVFVSNPQLYGTVRVVSSVVKSDHKAVVALPSGLFQLPDPQSATLSRISSGTRPPVQTVSDVCLKRTCSLDTSAFSALEVLDDNRAICYLLNYLLTYNIDYSI